jgi:ligand-binding sensor domain-containing protein
MRALRRLVPAAGQLAAGTLIVAGIWLLISRLSANLETQRLPAGWSIIRPPHEVSCLLVVGDQIWCGGWQGLVVVDRASGEPAAPPPGTPAFSYVRALIRDRGGAIWVGHEQGLARFDGSAWWQWNDLDGEPIGPILSLLEARDGRLWIGREEGVVLLGDGSLQPLDLPERVSLVTVDAIIEDSQGLIWLGSASPTHGRLVSFDGTDWTSHEAGRELPHPAVNMIVEDRGGVLWVATGFANRGGAARLDGGAWTWLTREDGLAGEKVRSIFQDRDGRLWFGSEYDGVAVLDHGSWTVIPPGAGLAGREVKVVIQDPDGVYWIGTDGGLNRVLQYNAE